LNSVFIGIEPSGVDRLLRIESRREKQVHNADEKDF